MFVAIRLEALAAFALRNDDFHRALGLLGRADALFDLAGGSRPSPPTSQTLHARPTSRGGAPAPAGSPHLNQRGFWASSHRVR
jgi:hypothetical protein